MRSEGVCFRETVRVEVQEAVAWNMRGDFVSAAEPLRLIDAQWRGAP